MKSFRFWGVILLNKQSNQQTKVINNEPLTSKASYSHAYAWISKWEEVESLLCCYYWLNVSCSGEYCLLTVGQAVLFFTVGHCSIFPSINIHHYNTWMELLYSPLCLHPYGNWMGTPSAHSLSSSQCLFTPSVWSNWSGAMLVERVSLSIIL